MCQPSKFLSSEDAMGDDGLYHSKKTPTRIVCAMGMLVSSCVECSQWDFILQGHSIILTLHMVLSSVRRSQIALCYLSTPGHESSLCLMYPHCIYYSPISHSSLCVTSNAPCQVWYIPLIQHLGGGAEAEDLSEYEASMFYVASFRLARAHSKTMCQQTSKQTTKEDERAMLLFK